MLTEEEADSATDPPGPLPVGGDWSLVAGLAGDLLAHLLGALLALSPAGVGVYRDTCLHPPGGGHPLATVLTPIVLVTLALLAPHYAVHLQHLIGADGDWLLDLLGSTGWSKMSGVCWYTH